MNNLKNKLLIILTLVSTTSSIMPFWGGYGWGYPYGGYYPYGYGYGAFGAVAGTIGTIATVEAIRSSNRNFENNYNNSSDREKAKLIKQARSQLYDLEERQDEIREKYGINSAEYKEHSNAVKEQRNFVAKLAR